ncbi:hypothetical protein QBC32DRAFT_374668 [Pseudoneurospora amorphoporcata]|uniref:Uncharacterized protein n=1 Tax=Pseudoneurospora amorphoporcata TaxID=241081 RepID=A0AAN6NJV4_9PEZI|nr:hypothetical protein QBC32DRAFT_374668 [Pseudoneurospora amorphoporcata]
MEVQPSGVAHIPPLPAEHPMFSMQLCHTLSSIITLRRRTATDGTLAFLSLSPPKEESQPQDPSPFFEPVSPVAPVGCGEPSPVALEGEKTMLIVEAVDADDSAVGAEETAVVDDEMADNVDKAVSDTNRVVVKLGEVVELTTSLVEGSFVVVVEVVEVQVNVDDEVSVLDVAVGTES